MGMFDSFYVEIDGREQALQSKRFDCLLNDYYRGDLVSGSMAGVQVFFDEIYLDSNGKYAYGEGRKSADKKVIFVVLSEGIFVDDQVHSGELGQETILAIVNHLKTKWKDSARMIDFMRHELINRQKKINNIEIKIERIKSVISTVKSCELEDEPRGWIKFLYKEEDEKLAAGEEPLDVIQWIIEQTESDNYFPRYGALPDFLDEFRL
ncbi:hypothetical protein D5085_11150 [Ectothiorhodospiraceae bacterium BW-2]|nr:hypothetical protein D5085_11150 [Ectothiorhodospiraceae bacterium BW-2]